MTKFKDAAYYEQLDKRTKEYKAWKEFMASQAKQESFGLGDAVEAVSRATGIKDAVKLFFGEEDCGCDGRQDYLNKKLTFAKGVVNMVDADDYEFLTEVFSRDSRQRYSKNDLDRLVYIYNYVYEKREVSPGCTTCRNTNILKCIAKLNMYYRALSEFIETNYEDEE